MEKSEKTALIAIFINFFLFGIKVIAAYITGSIALKAEAFHTFTDFVASLTGFIGLKIAKRKTRAFPYGLYKIENLISVVISLLILYTGYEIVVEALNTTQAEIKNSGLGIVILIVAVIITFLFSRYEKKIGKKIGSPILLADAEHIRSDVLSNSIVMVAVIAGSRGYQFDKIAALIVVVFIVKAGLGILKDGVRVLLDASIDYETLSKTEKIIENTSQVVQIKTLKGRNSGRFKFIEANIVIKTHDLNKAHLIADKIESQIKQEFNNIDQILIHYEPMQKEDMKFAIPLNKGQDYISSHLGEAPKFLFATFRKEEKSTSHVEVVENPFIEEEKGKGILVAEFLIKNGVDVMIIKKDFASKGPAYVFSDANVETVLTEEDTPVLAMEKIGLYIKED